MKHILILFTIVVPLQSWSQITSSSNFCFQLPIAINEFRKTNGYAPNAGVRMNIYMSPSTNFPIQIGIDAGLFGRQHGSDNLQIDIAGYPATYIVKASNSVFNIGFLLKFAPFSTRRFSPYIEGTFGGNDFFSTIYLYPKGRSGDSQNISRNEDTQSRWGIYYGGSAGLRMALGKMQVYGIEIKCSFLKGAETSYNDKPEFYNNETVDFERLRSATDMIIPQLGMWVNLSEAKREN